MTFGGSSRNAVRGVCGNETALMRLNTMENKTMIESLAITAANVGIFAAVNPNAFLALVTVGALASALGAVSALRLFTDKEVN